MVRGMRERDKMSTVTTATQVLDKSEVDRRISQAAAGLRSLGVDPGDGVALCPRNDVAFFEVSMGAGQIGANPVAVNWHYTVDEFRYLLQDCQARVLVIHADLLRGLREAIPAGVTVLVVPVDEAIARAYGIGAERARVEP